MDLIQAALDEGLQRAVVIPTKDVPFNKNFRAYCEENLCGQYGANYSCPPACGSFEEMHARVMSKQNALVVQSVWDISDHLDREKTAQAQFQHNAAMLRLLEQMQQEGRDCFMAGASCCTLCKSCAMRKGEPCPFPEKRYSCLSAYCMFVKELADRCGMEYDCGPGKVGFFGMIMY